MKTLLTLLALGFVISASAQERRVERPTTRPAARPTGTIAPIIDPDARPVPREAVLRNDSLLKVNVTYQGYAPHIPWQKESPGQRRGLGVFIDGNRVLVTGQLVADATYIELELADSGQ